MGFVRSLLGQCRKPSGWLGRLVVRNMNHRHGPLTDWGLTHVELAADAAVLDVGCGGGRTVARLAARAVQGRVCGVDVSAASLAEARRTNRAAIARGSVEIREAGVSQLPYADGTFDLVTAVETHYYWPDLPADVREVRRVLRPGGVFLLVAEAYRSARHAALVRHQARLDEVLGFHLLSAEEHRALLAQAGFAEVEVWEEHARGWICARGRRGD